MGKVRHYALTGALALGVVLCGSLAPVSAQTVIDQWTTVKDPPAPALHNVKADPKTMAFLILDVVKRICGNTPECMASLPKMKAFLAQARAHHMPVVYSSVGGQSAADIMKQVAPTGSEPLVVSHADKFIGTKLNQILKKLNVKTLIIVGTASDGAVLYTASHAAFLGYKVIVPIDGATSRDPFADKATAYLLTHAPAVGQATTLTSFDKISW